MAELLAWLDAAKLIVAYNGSAFDMRAIRRAYGGDDARWQAHMAKLHDPMIAAHRAAGRRLRLSTLLQRNGLGEKAGTGSDAPRLWEEGRLEALERYCARDTQALTELVLLREVRVQQHTFTRDLSVLEALLDTGADAMAGGTVRGRESATEGEPAAQRQHTGAADGRREGGGGTDGMTSGRPARAAAGRRPSLRATMRSSGDRGGVEDRHADTWTGAARAAEVRSAAQW